MNVDRFMLTADSPMCTNRPMIEHSDCGAMGEEEAQNRVLVFYAMRVVGADVCRAHRDAGRQFPRERASAATSRTEPGMIGIEDLEGIDAHMCCTG